MVIFSSVWLLWTKLIKAQPKKSMRMFNFANQVNFRLQCPVVEFCSWRYQSSASSFHTYFGPGRAFLASIQGQGEFQTSSFEVFNVLGLCRLALTRALGFPARFGHHQHWLVRVAPAAGTAGGGQHWQLASAWTGRLLATSISCLAQAALLSMNPVASVT